MGKSEFIIKAERRAARRAAMAEKSADAHMEPWHEMRRGQELETVAESVAFQRAISGATGIPETEYHETKRVEANRRIPDPMMTDSEYLYQRSKRPDDLNVGKVWATENALSRIGALCYVRQRLRHHEIAAEQFKALYEALYGVGNAAMDPSRIQVDTSPIAHDSGMAGKIDRTWKLHQAESALGKPTFDRLIALCVLCIPAGDGAPTLPSGRPNDRWVRRSVETALDDLDRLSAVWGFKSKAA